LLSLRVFLSSLDIAGVTKGDDISMKFIFSTGSLYTYGIERCFALAAQAGFDGIELMVDQRWDTRSPDYLLPLAEQYALPILAVHSPFAPVPGWSKATAQALIIHTVSLAEALAAEVVVHHLPTVVDIALLQSWNRRMILPALTTRQQAYQRWLQTEYVQLQSIAPVTLCIENLPAFSLLGRPINYGVWNTVEEITRFPHICMDTTHLATFGLDPVRAYRRWRHHIRHVHLSNYDGRQHRRPEDGWLPLDRLLGIMAADGYQRTISLELHPDALKAGAPDAQIAAHMRASLQACRDWAAAGTELSTERDAERMSTSENSRAGVTARKTTHA
jgi:sugar phosphate isomerase/epimerase